MTIIAIAIVVAIIAIGFVIYSRSNSISSPSPSPSPTTPSPSISSSITSITSITPSLPSQSPSLSPVTTYQPTVIATTSPPPTPTPSTAIIPMEKQTTPFTDDVSGYWLLHIADNIHNLTNNEDIIILLQKYPPRDSNWPNHWASTQITGKAQSAKIPAIQANASSSFMMIHYFSPENVDQSISWVGNDKNYLNYGQYGGDTVYLKRVYSNDGKIWSTYV